jgi:superfamily II DNA helicase RecQ
MSLQYNFFVISIKDIQGSTAEMNRFLRTVRVLNAQREFIPQGENSFWTVSVEYIQPDAETDENAARKKEKIDYREALSPEDFSLYAKLRDWRKETAKAEAVQVYTIFTNEQLAKIAQNKIQTKAGLEAIEGVGDARVKKYGDDVIKIVLTSLPSSQSPISPKKPESVGK